MKNGINHQTETYEVVFFLSLCPYLFHVVFIHEANLIRRGVKTKQLKCDFQMTTNYYLCIAFAIFIYLQWLSARVCSYVNNVVHVEVIFDWFVRVKKCKFIAVKWKKTTLFLITIICCCSCWFFFLLAYHFSHICMRNHGRSEIRCVWW